MIVIPSYWAVNISGFWGYENLSLSRHSLSCIRDQIHNSLGQMNRGVDFCFVRFSGSVLRSNYAKTLQRDNYLLLCTSIADRFDSESANVSDF